MRLTFPWASSASKALDTALARASEKPMPPLRGDRIKLEGPLPPGFKRQSMQKASGYCIEVNAHGNVFGLMETEGSSSGGFGGSCIPVAALIALLNLWTSQQAAPAAPSFSSLPIQGELF